VTAYTLTRSRRKTIAIHIKPDGAVEVRAPLRLAKSEIERFIKSKTRWIEKKQAQIAARQPAQLRELPPSQYGPGEFEQTARQLVNEWAQRLGVTATFVGFRAMTSRWGSCTAKTGRIRLNTALAYCPRECLEYVAVHEAAHLRESNHSPRFWAIIAEALPDYKLRQKKLKELSWLLNAQGRGMQNED
jgi:predicted metal-dependent hydrolase